jgi:hypothetical protein
MVVRGHFVLRDRALIALMTYTFARVSAATEMKVEDYYRQGKRWWVRLHEKGGKRQTDDRFSVDAVKQLARFLRFM